MSRPNKATQGKRLRELAKQDKRKEKAERRAKRQAEKANQPVPADGSDPDLAGIVPGPQPITSTLPNIRPVHQARPDQNLIPKPN
jgi:hypothetical protein